MATNKSRKELLKNVYDIFNKGNFDELDKYIDQNIIENNPDPFAPDDLQGIELIKATLKTYKKAFPDLKFESQLMVEEGDKIVSYLKVKGKHTQELSGISPTHKEISIDGCEMIRFEGDKAVEHWNVFDNLTMLTQLGLGIESGGVAESNQ
jgi:predicted ester cyclase